MTTKEVIIIGGGPAGLACSMQLTRSRIDNLVIEKNEAGGLLFEAGLIENYPGFPKGIEARNLIDLMLRQSKEIGVNIMKDEVERCDFRNDSFRLKAGHQTYSSSFLVVATGTEPVRWTGCPIPGSVEDITGYGVRKFRDVPSGMVAIIGAGDAAFDYALQMEASGHQVAIFSRTDRTRCLPLLKERVLQKEKIGFHPHHRLDNIEPGKDGKGLTLSFDAHEKSSGYVVDYLIFATGRKPVLELISEISNDQREQLTRNNKLLFAGDVVNGNYRQTGVAVGDGIRVAMKIAGVAGK